MNRQDISNSITEYGRRSRNSGNIAYISFVGVSLLTTETIYTAFNNLNTGTSFGGGVAVFAALNGFAALSDRNACDTKSGVLEAVLAQHDLAQAVTVTDATTEQ